MSQDIRKSFSDGKNKTSKWSVSNADNQASLGSLATPVTSALKRSKSNADLSPPSPAIDANIMSKQDIVSSNQAKIDKLQKTLVKK